MMIEKKIHRGRKWKADEIAPDFDLWDVWELPLDADNSKKENFPVFNRIFAQSFERVKGGFSVTGFLFSLRNLLGKIFDFDKNINSMPIPGCKEISVTSRLDKQDAKKSKKGFAIRDKDSGLEFLPVYLYESESLYELSNDTVHALLHFGWIKKENNFYTATLAIYVKPRGFFGKAYLKIIEPFRRFIVYPAIMRMIKREWEKNFRNDKKLSIKEKICKA